MHQPSALETDLLETTERRPTHRRALSEALLRAVLGDGVHRTPTGRPLAPGERAENATVGVTHDGGLLVVARHRAGCGVDVEDTESELFAEVAPRFCAPFELDRGIHPRALWTVKESVAKALGLGLTARLRSLHAIGDPTAAWVPVTRDGRPLGRVVTVLDLGPRHLAVTVGGRPPSAVVVRCWRTGPVGPVRITPDGALAATAAAIRGLAARDGGDGAHLAA